MATAMTDSEIQHEQDKLHPTITAETGVSIIKPGGLQDHALERSFSVWSLGGLCLCLMATWEALSSTVAQALISGGAPCLFWN